MIETIATVEENVELAPGYKLLTLAFDETIDAKAGQFAMVKPRGALEPLLRRALAVYRSGMSQTSSLRRHAGPRALSFLYQVLGPGTQALGRLTSGRQVEALVPLGNSWPIGLEARPAAGGASGRAAERAIVVAGGIGSASVFMLCEELARMGVETHIFLGAAGRNPLLGCGLEDFKGLGLPLTLTTDDGSLGESGFVTGPLERYLREGGATGATIYSCGPWVMMRRTAEIALRFGVPCLVSLEAPMGCGFGVCVGCVFEVKTAQPRGYGSYKRVCVDGSIFPAETVRWETAAMIH